MWGTFGNRSKGLHSITHIVILDRITICIYMCILYLITHDHGTIDHITILYLSPSHARHSLLWSSPSLVERYRMIWASCESSHLIWPMENPGIYDLFPLDGVEHGFCFSIYWECHHTNLLIFLRGVGIPPTRFHFFYFFTMCFLNPFFLVFTS